MPRRCGVALDPDGQGQDAAQDEERLERPERGAGLDLDPLDLGDHGPSDPATTPAIRSLWPPRNLVADSTTRSAPSSSGRQTYGRGERVVDDVGRAVAMGELGERGVVGDERRRVGDRLGVEDPGRRARRARPRPRRGSVVSTRSTVDAEPAERAEELRPGRAVDRHRGHDAVAGPEQRCERGVDRAHAGRQGHARLAAGELRVGGAERARRRVGDPAVGVPGARVGGDAAELVRVGRGERRGLVDRDARRRLVEPRDRARPPGWRGSRSRAGVDARPRVGVAHGADATPDPPGGRVALRCARPDRPGRPVTRSLPARFEAYIAPSALIISSSAVRPSSG